MADDLTTVVVPTVGRPSLRVLLEALARGSAPVPGPVLLVDDRPGTCPPLDAGGLPLRLHVLPGGARGPAHARNVGWRHARTPWVSFLDDDVVPDDDWSDRLAADLTGSGPPCAGSQGRLRVPLPQDRRPTDWERGTAGLAGARWITADMSYRRAALARVGGFDERFTRAFREDADLGLRITAEVGPIVEGRRTLAHPARPADRWASVRQQRGNADDFLMRALHGPDWHRRAGAPRGRRRRHLLTVGAAVVALGGALAGRRTLGAVAASTWVTLTAELAWRRIAPGPRDRAEAGRMLATSLAIPFAATWHSVRGAWVHRGAARWRGLPDLVLFDRDGTLVVDVPHNADPDAVVPVPGAEAALASLRRAGIRLGVVTNQSGIGRGLLTPDEARRVDDRVRDLLGPFDVWRSCPHAPDARCPCRKPSPGMVRDACAAVGVPEDRCVVIGDIGSDIDAAAAAGAAGVLVPTPQTRGDEVRTAPRVAWSLCEAVGDVLGGQW